jgi:TPR repeat protein
LVQAAVITAVVVKEQGAPSGGSLATPGSLAFEPDAPPRAKVPGADVAVKTLAAEQPPAVAANPPGPPWPAVAATQPAVAEPPVAQANASPMLSDEEIAALVAGGRQLMIAGDIRNARLVLQQAAEAGNATAALELGATYDPIELAKLGVRDGSLPAASIKGKALPDIAMARTWYQKAKDLGSTEAQGRLENLARRDRPKR